MACWRLLELEAHDGATNLALDEALAEAVAAGASLPTLRLYTWSAPCLALGSFQPAADLAPDALAGLGPRVVRRCSGGTAVLHDGGHLGYSLALPPGHPLAPPDVLEAYRRVNERVAAALRTLGPAAEPLSVAAARAVVPDPLLRPACYGGLTPQEIVVAGRKLVGSAQVRRRGVVLHEGGVLLRFDAAATARWLAAPSPEVRRARTERLDAVVTDLERELGHAVALPEVAAALVAALARDLGGGAPRAGTTPSDAELARAAELRRTKYLDPGWTMRR